MSLDLKTIDYLLIIFCISALVLIVLRWIKHREKIRSSEGFATRRIFYYLLIAYFALTGIVPTLTNALMDKFGIEVPKNYTEYSFISFALLVAAAMWITRRPKEQKKESTNVRIGDDVQGDKIQGDKVARDQYGGDNIGRDKFEGDKVGGDKFEGDQHNYYVPQKDPDKELTTIYRKHPDSLIGRKNALDNLRQRLTEQQQVVVVNGMGGIGKTSLAEAYAFKYYHDYERMVWITQSQDDIALDFSQDPTLTKNLKIDSEGKQPPELFSEIINTLNNLQESPKLLIIDNAFANLAKQLSLLPKQPNWHLLVTSRRKIEGLEVLELGFLSEEDAVALFQKYCTRIKDIEVIQELVHTVELHTLTIEILARAAEKQKASPENLKKALEHDLRANVTTQYSGENKIERITSYISTLFDFSLLSEDEQWLLKQFCALPPDFLQYTLLRELISPESSGRDEVFAETLENLVSKGWLLKAGAEESYRMHRIILEASKIKLSISGDDLGILTGAIADLLSLDQAKDNPVDKFIWVPFGLACLKLLEPLNNEHKSRLQSHTGLILQDLGDYQEAKKLLEAALISDKKNFGKDHPTTAVRYSNLALVLKDLGDYQGAKKLLEAAMTSDEKNFGKDHPNTAIRYSNLATVLRGLGDYQEAKKLLEAAMISDENNFGKDHPKTTSSYSNLAMVLKNLGDYQGAKKLLEATIISDEKNFGKDHPNTAVTYSNLAIVLKELGDNHGAKKLLEAAMTSDEKNFGKDHPNTAVTYSNLALVLEDLGDYQEAKKLLEAAMTSDEKNFGKDHPNTAIRYSNLALVLKNLGDYQGAKKLLEVAKISDEKNFGSDHPNTAILYTNLAMVLQDLDELDEAVILAEKAEQIVKASLPNGHPTIEVMKGNLAVIRQAIKERGA